MNNILVPWIADVYAFCSSPQLLNVAVMTSNSRESFQGDDRDIVSLVRGEKKKKKNHGTQDSRVVPHRGTN